MSVFGNALPSSVMTIHRGLCRTAAAAGGLGRDELAALVVLLRHGTAEALAQLFFYCSADGAEGEERVSVDQLIIMLKAACRDAGLDMNASSAATVASGTKSALDRDQLCALFWQDESQSVLANVLVKLSGAAAAHFGLPLTKAEAVVQLAPPSPSAWDHVQGQWRSTLLAALLLSLWGEERGASGMPAVHVHTSLMFNSHACSCSRHCRMVHLQCLRGSGVQQGQQRPRGCTPVRICHYCSQHGASASCHLQNDGRAAGDLPSVVDQL